MEINQKSYDDIINNLDLNRLQCSGCNHFGVKIHGYYDRAVKTKTGVIRLIVMRVKCRECHKTHSVLLSLIVPYQSISLKDQITIIRNNNKEVKQLLKENLSISYDDISRVRHNYKTYYLERLRSFSILIDENIVSNCFKTFKRQFLQIKCTLNIFFV